MTVDTAPIDKALQDYVDASVLADCSLVDSLIRSIASSWLKGIEHTVWRGAPKDLLEALQMFGAQLKLARVPIVSLYANVKATKSVTDLLPTHKDETGRNT